MVSVALVALALVGLALPRAHRAAQDAKPEWQRLRDSCAAGSLLDCGNLGVMYENGSG